MELPELGDGDDPGAEKASMFRCETAGFRTTCSGTGIRAMMFMSLLGRAGLHNTNG